MKLLYGSLALVASATGFSFTNFNMEKLMTLQAMRSQFDEDQIGDEQQNALMKHFTGASDLQLFMSRQMSADDFKLSMKRQMKDKMITQILQGGGIDLSNPLWRRHFFRDDRDDSELFTESMPEPQQSIIRLIRDSDAENQEFGRDLLKKYQYKQFNTEGNYLTENFDYILLADDRQSAIKDVIQQSMLESIADPLDRAMIGLLQKSKVDGIDSAEKARLNLMIRDIQKIKIFEGSVPEVSPVNPDHLYTFYQITNGELQPHDILSLALDERNAFSQVSELDFERYFGSPAKQFSCRAHVDAMKVPCGVDLTGEECLHRGCCYQPSSAGIPSCFSDLYGKIGSGLLRQEFITSNDDQDGETLTGKVEGLFVNGIPTLAKLLREETPMHIRGWNTDTGNLALSGLNPVTGHKNWWDSATVTGQDNANGETVTAHVTQNLEADRPRYGRPGYVWRPHGPTASPYHASMPGINPTAAPGHQFGDLNNYYSMWLSYAAEQDEASCALIGRESRVKCMDNYEALVDSLPSNIGGSSALCKSLGCCFNEDSFLSGSHACYRASNYGKCVELPTDFVKRACGSDGISEQECIANPRCCYQPLMDRSAPWCFYKYSATLDESEWCTAWNLKENAYKRRTPCFGASTASNNLFEEHLDNDISNVNNLVSEEQCLAADCCFDGSRGNDAIEWLQQGLDQEGLYRCFDKTNPAIAPTLEYIEQTAVNHNLDSDGNQLPEFSFRQKTCDQTQWNAQADTSAHHIFKRSCGEGLSYFQCVYNNRCCYQATTSNEPTCYHPEFLA